MKRRCTARRPPFDCSSRASRAALDSASSGRGARGSGRPAGGAPASRRGARRRGRRACGLAARQARARRTSRRASLPTAVRIPGASSLEAIGALRELARRRRRDPAGRCRSSALRDGALDVRLALYAVETGALLAAPHASAPLATPGTACEDTAARLLERLGVPASAMPAATPPLLDELAASGRALRRLEAGDLALAWREVEGKLSPTAMRLRERHHGARRTPRYPAGRTRARARDHRRRRRRLDAARAGARARARGAASRSAPPAGGGAGPAGAGRSARRPASSRPAARDPARRRRAAPGARPPLGCCKGLRGRPCRAPAQRRARHGVSFALRAARRDRRRGPAAPGATPARRRTARGRAAQRPARRALLRARDRASIPRPRSRPCARSAR